MKSPILIAYFSGTGNSARVSTWIRDIASKEEFPVIEVNISKIPDEFDHIWQTVSTIILVYPTHGFNAPPVFYSFFSRIGSCKGKEIYLLNTRGGGIIGNRNSPGISGVATLWPAFLFWIKGAKVKGIVPVDLPSNWISLHPAIRKKAHLKIHEIWRTKIARITHRILRKEKIYKGMWSLPIDILTIPIACLYYSFGRFALAKTFYASPNCNACGSCSKNCPFQSIEMTSGRPFWKMSCESCMKCMNQCPQKAIQTAHGWFLLTWISILYLIEAVIHPYCSERISFPFQQFHLFEIVVMCLLTIPTAHISYLILHRLLKNQRLNSIITRTSLTSFNFWGRFHNTPKKPKV